MENKSPSLTVDGVVTKKDELLLIQRANPPFKDKWALPGGFVEYGEKTEEAVQREVFEETGLETKILSLIGVYSDPNRDPRGHTVSVVYKLEKTGGKLMGADDASKAKFFEFDKIPELAFDHKKIIKDSIKEV